MAQAMQRRFPVGAEVVPQGVHFRVWAPKRRQVEVAIEGQVQRHPLQREADGYYSGLVRGIGPGARYRLVLDGGDAFPDPASRYQPHGPHGPSEVVDPAAYRWQDQAWPGASLKGQVIYELHVGTFTPEGTWAAAERQLPELARLGITCVEMMPVADFPGRFGWGYDGVNLFAPTRLYGTPDDLRRFVDTAHQLGLAVILDVVYNHLGPDGNYLAQFADAYFNCKHRTDWGEPINFDGSDCQCVREFYRANAAYWIDEFHFDGLRLDATHAMYDDAVEPGDHILAQLGQAVRDAAQGRRTFIVAENDAQWPRLARPIARGGYGLDGVWNDDFHHAARVALGGRREGYYSDFRGHAQELLSAIKYGYLFQGQWHAWHGQTRGQPGLDLPPQAFILYLQNHDQIAHSAHGRRIHQTTSPGRARAITALWLLAPGTPMFFQGQEFAASAPFLYFADHEPVLAGHVRAGRRQFLTQFASISDPAIQEQLADPGSEATFLRCKLDFSERDRHRAWYDLTKDLLRLRREETVFAEPTPRGVDGAVITESAFILRFFARDGRDGLLIVNLGQDVVEPSLAEPLLVPPEGRRWRQVLSTEDPRYDGGGTPRIDWINAPFRFPGEATIVWLAEPT